MNVIKASVMGYCMGVRRAVESAEKALEENSRGDEKKRIYTLGPLIHNPVVLDSLKERGVGILSDECVDGPDSEMLRNSVVIVRAHGTTGKIYTKLENLGADVRNSTCPRVIHSQKIVSEYSSKGYGVILAGDRNHGEVVSISSFSEKPVDVIENSAEAEKLECLGKTVLLAQTTFSPTEYEKIIAILKDKNPEIEIFNSICTATMQRQKALKEFEGRVDGIIVIGGKISANTRRLYETALTLCPKAALVENESEIPPEFHNMESVGITAGASTPDFLIDRIVKSLTVE